MLWSAIAPKNDCGFLLFPSWPTLRVPCKTLLGCWKNPLCLFCLLAVSWPILSTTRLFELLKVPKFCRCNVDGAKGVKSVGFRSKVPAGGLGVVCLKNGLTLLGVCCWLLLVLSWPTCKTPLKVVGAAVGSWFRLKWGESTTCKALLTVSVKGWLPGGGSCKGAEEALVGLRLGVCVGCLSGDGLAVAFMASTALRLMAESTGKKARAGSLDLLRPTWIWPLTNFLVCFSQKKMIGLKGKSKRPLDVRILFIHFCSFQLCRFLYELTSNQAFLAIQKKI